MITAFPHINWRDFFLPTLTGDPILGSERSCLYASGRAAIFHAAISLDNSTGGVFLLPSFHCGVEVEAVQRAGFKVEYYNIRRDLSVDLDSLRERVGKSTKAILVIHYFGFSQDLAETLRICQENQLYLVEDAAHALYSRNPDGTWVGTIGDFGVFSLHKTIPIPNGGVLLVRDPSCRRLAEGITNLEPSVFKSMARSILEFEVAARTRLQRPAAWLIGLYERYSRIRGQGMESMTNDNERWYYDVERFGYEKSLPRISRLLLGKQSYENVSLRRRMNYLALEEALRPEHGPDFVYARLPDGVSPLCFPIYVSNRDTVAAAMANQGVATFVFGRHSHPTFDADRYPDASYLSSSIIGLPVHQQLTTQDVEKVCDTFLSTIRKNRND
jgi:dTDP-4-amino-4,6-dideoxygalactose transaminase